MSDTQCRPGDIVEVVKGEWKGLVGQINQIEPYTRAHAGLILYWDNGEKTTEFIAFEDFRHLHKHKEGKDES